MPGFPLPENRHRPTQTWLQDLKRAKQECAVGLRSKLTVADIVERANDAGYLANLDPSSPRSVDAFLRRGVEPEDIKIIPAKKYRLMTRPELSDLADMAYAFQEKLRQERIRAVQDERKFLLDGGDIAAKKKPVRPPTVPVAGVDVGDMVEKEAKRLEVTRRRQERELSQMVAYEMARKEQQEKAEAKLKAFDAKADEQRRVREAADAQWRDMQRTRDLKRRQDDERRDAEAKALEAARYAKDLDMARKEAFAEKQRRRAGFLQEQERIAKVEQARKETERILAEQQAEVERKKADMHKRDEAREAAKMERQAEVKLKNDEARAKASHRMQATLQANRTILKQRRAEYDQRQRETEARRLEKEAIRAAAEAEARRKEEEAEHQRQEAYRQAQERERMRVDSILAKTAAKTASLEATYLDRDHENARIALARQLELNLRRQKVEEMQRRQLYQRDLLLQRIEEQTRRTFSMKASRADLQEQRRNANMKASFERQQLMQSIERLQASTKLSKFVGSGGEVNLSALLTQTVR